VLVVTQVQTYLFARNSLCALARSNLGLNQDNLLDRLLDPTVRIATSTPGSDPLGTYSWEVFARADALKPGARATLEANAKKLVGGGEKTPLWCREREPSKAYSSPTRRMSC
jgi:molybdate transport system substrate-binding protein